MYSRKSSPTPIVGVPIVNHDDNQHAANENLRLQNLWDGIDAYAAMLADLDW
jgi:acetylornithine deacetylase/succinyl-diaminopimelate desuccinylase-like protein